MLIYVHMYVCTYHTQHSQYSKINSQMYTYICMYVHTIYIYTQMYLRISEKALQRYPIVNSTQMRSEQTVEIHLKQLYFIAIYTQHTVHLHSYTKLFASIIYFYAY